MSEHPGSRPLRPGMKFVRGVGLPWSLAVAIVVGAVDAAFVSDPAIFARSMSARKLDCVVSALIADGTWIRGTVARIDSDGWHLLPIGAAAPSATGRATTIRPIAIVADLDGWSAWNLAGMREASEAQPAGMLVTQDGQLIPGALELDGAVPRWNHRWIGKIPLELDRIRSLRLARGVRIEPRDDADVVALVNGDELVGFVESIGSEVEIDSLVPPRASEADRDGLNEATDPLEQQREQPDDARPSAEDQAGGTRAIDLARVTAISFVSTGATDTTTPRAWTRDGSVVACRDPSIGQDGSLSFLLADEMLSGIHPDATGSNLAADAVAILVEPDRIRPLVELAASGAKVPGNVFRAPRAELGFRAAAPDHLLGLGELRVLGPQSIGVDASGLQDAECVFTANLSILEPAPVDAAVGVEIRADGTTVGAARVTASGAVEMTARIPAGIRRIEFVVDDGGNGIVGDRLLVRRGAIIVGARRPDR